MAPCTTSKNAAVCSKPSFQKQKNSDNNNNNNNINNVKIIVK